MSLFRHNFFGSLWLVITTPGLIKKTELKTKNYSLPRNTKVQQLVHSI